MVTDRTCELKKKEDREFWIDYIKVFACVLVVLGHFFQSMVKAAVLPDNSLYQWFNTVIYYFHVPLFFICSGYLYQRYSSVDNILSWEQKPWHLEYRILYFPLRHGS